MPEKKSPVVSVTLQPDEVSVPLERIVVDEHYQVRIRLDDERVNAFRRMYEMDSPPGLPPVSVADVNGVLYLMDGFHRVRAQAQLGRLEIRVTIQALPSIEEVMWQGATVNAQHGLPLSGKERYRRFVLYLKTGRHYKEGKPREDRFIKSYSEIGREFAVHHQTASKWMQKAAPKLWARLQTDGTLLNQRGGNKGKIGTNLTPEELVTRNLNNARNTFAAVKDTDARGRLIHKSEEVTEAMRTGKPWTEGDF